MILAAFYFVVCLMFQKISMRVVSSFMRNQSIVPNLYQQAEQGQPSALRTKKTTKKQTMTVTTVST